MSQLLLTVLFAIFAISVVQIFYVAIFGAKAGYRSVLEYISSVLLSPSIHRLNRKDRSKKALLFRGGIIALVCAFIVFLIHYSVHSLSKWALLKSIDIHSIVFAFVVFGSFSTVTIFFKALQFVRLNEDDEDKKKNVYRAVAKASATNLIHHDEYGLNRHMVRLLVFGFTQYIIAPILVFLLFRAAGLIIFAFANVILNAAGRADYGGAFAWAARLVLYPVYFLSQFITVLFFYAASIFVGYGSVFQRVTNIGRCMKIKTAHIFEGGIAVNMMALTLGVTLGGPYQDKYGQGVTANWVGAEGASSQVKRADVLRAAFVYITAFMLLLIALILAAKLA